MSIEESARHPSGLSSLQSDLTRAPASALDTPSASPQRFVDHGDGTVTDVQTGLMWMRCAEGQNWTGAECIGAAKEFTFEAAQAIRRAFAGFSDWRLPTPDELKSIVDTSRTGLTIDTDIFYGCESAAPLFWTSSLDGKMWHVNFRFGAGYYAIDNSRDRVRLVRKAAPPLSKSKSEGLISIGPNPEHPTQSSVQGDLTHLSSSALEVPSAWPQRFVDHGDGTVTDVQTGLMWMRCAEGQNWTGAGCTGAAKEFTFEEAQAIRREFAGRLEFAGFSDWRLPALDELKSIVDQSCNRPAIDTNLFCGCDDGSQFWASTFDDGVWQVSFYSTANYAVARNAESRVRLVRSISKNRSLKMALKEALSLPHIRGDLANFVLRNPRLINEKLFDQELTMLDLAIQSGGPEMVSWLIGKGALAKATDVVGNSPETTAGLQKAAVQEFPLDIRNSGSGAGTVALTPDLKAYPVGSRVKLTAHAAEGSIFTHWSGDVSGLDSANNLTIDAAEHVVANFESLDIPNLSLGVAIDIIEKTTMRSGDEAFIVYLSLTNKGVKQIRIELPAASYVNCHGEEFEQDFWLTGLVNGGEGASIRAGNFRRAGLVFYKSKLASISTGDCLHITVLQTKPSQRFNFSFRCTNQASNTFVLVKAELEDLTVQPEPDPVEVFPEESVILQRLDLLQSGLDEVLRRLERLEASPVAVAPHAPFEQEATTSTRTQVLAWLASQQRVSVAALRHRLLPLDLLPSAFIDEVNERALDFVGEPALEDQNDEVAVIQDVLAVVLAIWEGDSV